MGLAFHVVKLVKVGHFQKSNLQEECVRLLLQSLAVLPACLKVVSAIGILQSNDLDLEILGMLYYIALLGITNGICPARLFLSTLECRSRIDAIPLASNPRIIKDHQGVCFLPLFFCCPGPLIIGPCPVLLHWCWGLAPLHYAAEGGCQGKLPGSWGRGLVTSLGAMKILTGVAQLLLAKAGFLWIYDNLWCLMSCAFVVTRRRPLIRCFEIQTAAGWHGLDRKRNSIFNRSNYTITSVFVWIGVVGYCTMQTSATQPEQDSFGVC